MTVDVDTERAKFRVTTTFTITGRGPVAAGDIVAGTIRTGMRLILADGSVPIRSVEFVDNVAERTSRTGLLLGGSDDILGRIQVGTEYDVTD